MFDPKEYQVGDEIFVIHYGRVHSQTYTPGTVSRITPSGQVTVARSDGLVDRFTARGHLVGEAPSTWGPYTRVLSKAEAADAVAAIAEANQLRRIRKDVSDTLNAAGNIDPVDPDSRKLLIEKLSGLVTRLEFLK